ncbi:TonB family protein [Chachezhania antarctica]|uniref:TonB family protein n=1 Tax=Chachezhania antarctica TaxID=2340860 RepID=UPI000EADC0CE|nr:TonB family protein [Chachezhania antarctica]
MIPRSFLVAGVAGVAALGLHLGGVTAGLVPEPAQTEGGTVATADLGSAFEDLTQGTQTPEKAETLTALDVTEAPEKPEADPVEQAEPETMEKPEAETAETPEAEDSPETAEPVETEKAEAEPAEKVAADTVTAAPAEEATMAEGGTAVLQQTAEPDAETAAVSAGAAEPAEKVEAAKPEAMKPETVTPEPVKPTVMAAVPPEEVVQPVPELREMGPTDKPTLRPQARPEPKPEQVAQPKAAPKPKAAPQGNSTKNASKGSSSDRKTDTGAQGATAQAKAGSTGNAAAANYPGQVMRKIMRAKRGRLNARGAARVSFRIASNGALQSVSLSRSSGSSQLDQVAVQQIRRAAPFPPPPAGAQRTFSVQIKGQ